MDLKIWCLNIKINNNRAKAALSLLFVADYRNLPNQNALFCTKAILCHY